MQLDITMSHRICVKMFTEFYIAALCIRLSTAKKVIRNKQNEGLQRTSIEKKKTIFLSIIYHAMFILFCVN